MGILRHRSFRRIALMASNAAVAAIEPRAAYTEALRVLCTSLMQGNNGGPCGQVFLVTSSVSGEGKSMLSTNLAIVHAQRGKTVLLIDGDLRTPVLHKRLNLESDYGLSSLLFEGNIDASGRRRKFPSLVFPVSLFCRLARCPGTRPNCLPPTAWLSWCASAGGTMTTSLLTARRFCR